MNWRALVLTALMVLFATSAVLGKGGIALPNLERITVENAERVEQLATLGQENLYELAWSPRGEILAISGETGIWLYNAYDLEIQPQLLGSGTLFGNLTFNPDGSVLASIGFDLHPIIILWDVITGEQLAVLDANPSYARNLAFSPDGSILASGSGITMSSNREDDYAVWLWDVETGERLTGLRGHNDVITSLAFSPDGSVLVSASANEVWVWDLRTRKLLTVLEGHDYYVFSTVFSPDGSVLASGGGSPLLTGPASEDNDVMLWDTTTYKRLLVLEGHTWDVESLAYTPDGSVLASGSRDHTIRLWNARTGEILNVLRGHSESVYSVAFNPDGTLLASSGADGIAHLWGVPSEE